MIAHLNPLVLEVRTLYLNASIEILFHYQFDGFIMFWPYTWVLYLSAHPNKLIQFWTISKLNSVEKNNCECWRCFEIVKVLDCSNIDMCFITLHSIAECLLYFILFSLHSLHRKKTMECIVHTTRRIKIAWFDSCFAYSSIYWRR